MKRDPGSTGRWLKRLTQGLGAEPQDRGELLAVLRESASRGLIDADALALLALVAGQDVEPAEGSDGTDGRWRIARKVAPPTG